MGKQLVYVKDKHKYMWMEVPADTSAIKIISSEDVKSDPSRYKPRDEGLPYIWAVYFLIPAILIVLYLLQ